MGQVVINCQNKIKSLACMLHESWKVDRPGAVSYNLKNITYVYEAAPGSNIKLA